MSNVQNSKMREMENAAERASNLLKALGNEKRLMVLCHLANGELSVGELGKALEFGQAPLSQQLARLRRDGLVQTRREAQTIYYSLAGDETRRIIELLYEMYCAPSHGHEPKHRKMTLENGE